MQHPKRTHTGSVVRLLRNQRGNALITVGVALVMIFSFAAIAIDGAIMMTTKTQLQNAADAGALAAASGLLQEGEEEAIQRAINFTGMNRAVQERMAPVVIFREDVEFIDDDKVRVTTHRTRAHGDPLRSYFLRVLGALNLTDVQATAVARVGDVCGVQCVKPWAIPDRWNDENNNGIFDEGEFYDPIATGFLAPDDVGTILELKQGDPQHTVASGQFFPVALPPLGTPPGPITGADSYREWIANCAPYVVEPGDTLLLEPGNMVGPTTQGTRLLYDKDPDARWDPNAGDNGGVVNSAYEGLSPRVILVPFYDPRVPPVSGRKQVIVTKIGAFFMENAPTGNKDSVRGRFMRVAQPGRFCVNSLNNGFIVGIQLVE